MSEITSNFSFNHISIKRSSCHKKIFVVGLLAVEHLINTYRKNCHFQAHFSQLNSHMKWQLDECANFSFFFICRFNYEPFSLDNSNGLWRLSLANDYRVNFVKWSVNWIFFFVGKSIKASSERVSFIFHCVPF